MIDLERTLQQRFPHWFSGRRGGIARPLVRGLAQWSRIGEIDEFLVRHRHLRGFAFIEAALARLSRYYGGLRSFDRCRTSFSRDFRQSQRVRSPSHATIACDGLPVP